MANYRMNWRTMRWDEEYPFSWSAFLSGMGVGGTVAWLVVWWMTRRG